MPKVDELELKARVNEILNRWPAVGLAVGVVCDGSLAFFHGHGLADIAAQTPITADTVFPIASITKTVTAIAVMQLWERGLIDLDAPANDYLRAYQLVPAKASFRPATVRHLLTHTAGIPQVLHLSDWLFPVRGENFKAGHVPTLAAYYRDRGGLCLVIEPGTAFAYGDHTFATLGQIVEDVSGMTLGTYFCEHIFDPLGMADSDLAPSERVRSRLATGYTIGAHGVEAVADSEPVTAGAGSIVSTPRDMARYVAALLGGGANDHGRVLQSQTLATMFAPHYQPDPRLPGMGLGFFRRDVGGHLVVSHEGILPGFTSQLVAVPDDGLGLIAFTNGSSGAMAWLPTELGRLLRHLLGVPDEGVRRDVPHHPEIWGEICGRYRLPPRVSDLRGRAMMGGGVRVFVHGGRLMLRVLTAVPALYGGLPLHPDDDTDPYVFWLDLPRFGLPTVRLVFGHVAGAGTTVMHTDLGVQPVSLDKQSATRIPRLPVTGALGALAVVGAVKALRRPHQEMVR